MSSTDIDPNPNIPNQHVDQPNIRNRHRPQDNKTFPPPHLYATAPQLSPTDVSLLHPMSGILNIHQGSASLFAICQVFPDFTNRRRGRTNYLQPMPRLVEIFSTDARAIKTVTRLLRCHPKYWLPASHDALFRSTGHLTNRKIVVPVLWVYGSCTHFC